MADEQALTTGPPDFVGVGAQRCGTTWWFRLLERHPAVRPPLERKKELHFFDRFGSEEMRDEDVAAYHALFPRAPGEVVGEWTPRYMDDFYTPRLLHRAAPDARLLVLLRDPIERFRSGTIHRLERAPHRTWESSASDAIERGRYATQLERLLRFYPADRILVLQYEQCKEHSRHEFARTLAFLGVSDEFRPKAFKKARGTTTEPSKLDLWPEIVDGLRTSLEPEVERLAAMVPELDLSLWPHFAHLAAGVAAGEREPA